MEIIKVHQTENRCYKQNRKAKHIGILVHSTGAVNKNLNRYVYAPDRLGENKYGNHWNSSKADKAVHAFIGYDKNKEIIVAETLPLDIACWGCGKGNKGSYNYNPTAHIQFEICQSNTTDSDYYWKVIKVAEEYCAHLCKLYGWDSSNIVSHRESAEAGYASNHGDPESWMIRFGDNMNAFRERVQALLGTELKVETNKVPVPSETNKEVHTMKTLKQRNRGTQVRVLQYLLTNAGFDCGEIDGIFGIKTTKAVKSYQTSKGLTSDGIVGKKTWAYLLK